MNNKTILLWNMLRIRVHLLYQSKASFLLRKADFFAVELGKHGGTIVHSAFDPATLISSS